MVQDTLRRLQLNAYDVSQQEFVPGEPFTILTFELPHREENADLTERKGKRMKKQAEKPISEITIEQLESLTDRLSGRAEVLQRLQTEARYDDREAKYAG